MAGTSDDWPSLTAFLLARIEEDEKVARAANGTRWAAGDGNVSEGGLYALDDGSEDGWAIAWFELGHEDESKNLPAAPAFTYHAHENAVHAARHDPARVLRGVAAKRALIQQYTTERQRRVATARKGVYEYVTDHYPTWDGFIILAAMAVEYSDHPDYEELSNAAQGL